jgi:hypothetical protein
MKEIPKNGHCPYCDWKAPSWLSHKVMSLSKHIIHNHKEHYGHLQRDRWAGHEKKIYTKSQLDHALDEARMKVVNDIEKGKLVIGISKMKPKMKIKELRREMSNIILRMLNESIEDKYVIHTGKAIDQLLNLFTKTMGEERQIIMGELNLWRPIFYRDKVTNKDMKVLRQEMRSKLKSNT